MPSHIHRLHTPAEGARLRASQSALLQHNRDERNRQKHLDIETGAFVCVALFGFKGGTIAQFVAVFIY